MLVNLGQVRLEAYAIDTFDPSLECVLIVKALTLVRSEFQPG